MSYTPSKTSGKISIVSHISRMYFLRTVCMASRFFTPIFSKFYPQSLAKCLSCRCRQQREKYAVLRQEQSVSCQSKILPQYQNSLFAHFAPAGILLGSAFPKPCLYGLRRLKIPQNIFSDFSKTVPLHTLFFSY